MRRDEIKAWASAYIEAQQDPLLLDDGNPRWWAVDRFIAPDAHGLSADDCWLAILEVLERNPSDDLKGMLAAGPLEHLIHASGPLVIDRIEKEAATNSEFQSLLSRVWESSTPEIWARVQMATRRH